MFHCRDKRYIGLIELLQDPKKQQNHYHYSLDLYAAFDLKAKKDLKQAIYTVVNTNLERTWEEFNMRLGDLLTVDDDHVMVVVLNNITDAQYLLRSNISVTTVLKWDCDTKLQTKPSSNSPNHFLKKEFTILKSKFLDIVGSAYTVGFVPGQWYLADKDKKSVSIAHKLGETIVDAALPAHQAKDCKIRVFCMGGIDSKVANLKALCHKIFRCIIQGSVETIIAAIDISTTDGFVTQQDIIPNSLYENIPGTEISVFSAFHPEVSPISCVLVHIRKPAIKMKRSGKFEH